MQERLSTDHLACVSSPPPHHRPVNYGNGSPKRKRSAHQSLRVLCVLGGGECCPTVFLVSFDKIFRGSSRPPLVLGYCLLVGLGASLDDCP